MSLKRLVRFVSTDGKTYFGDAILPAGVTDARKATEANLVTGDVFASPVVEPTVLKIKELLSPLPIEKIRTVRCLGTNYKKHAKEVGMPTPKFPVLFYKPVTALGGPNSDIVVPPISRVDDTLDYECELIVVIGKKARDVSKADALNYVFGYAVGNDISQRGWQIKRGGSQWSLGKMGDGMSTWGPAIVTPEVIKDPSQLTIETTIITANGKHEKRQSELTSDMIFSVQDAISFLSQGSTLLPGDLIWMGTPSGVAMSFSPPKFLQKNQVCLISLSEVGSISNRVVHSDGEVAPVVKEMLAKL